MWTKLMSFFKDSETIFFARLNMLAGAVISAMLVVDPAIFGDLIPAKWFGVFLFVWGVVTEMARKARAEDM